MENIAKPFAIIHRLYGHILEFELWEFLLAPGTTWMMIRRGKRQTHINFLPSTLSPPKTSPKIFYEQGLEMQWQSYQKFQLSTSSAWKILNKTSCQDLWNIWQNHWSEVANKVLIKAAPLWLNNLSDRHFLAIKFPLMII